MLDNRRVVVTGAFGALGRSIVTAALQAGARVAAVDRAEEPGRDGLEGVAAIPGVDLSNAAEAGAAIGEAATALGGIDVLINAAGGFVWKPLEVDDGDTWARMHALNFQTALNAARAALPHLVLSPAGRMVNVGAFAALRAGAGLGAYAASKSALHRLTESLAEEYKGRVTVNAVLPSILDTPANRADMPNGDFSAWVSTSNLASVIVFLASDAACAVTGALVPVTGHL